MSSEALQEPSMVPQADFIADPKPGEVLWTPSDRTKFSTSGLFEPSQGSEDTHYLLLVALGTIVLTKNIFSQDGTARDYYVRLPDSEGGYQIHFLDLPPREDAPQGHVVPLEVGEEAGGTSAAVEFEYFSSESGEDFLRIEERVYRLKAGESRLGLEPVELEEETLVRDDAREAHLEAQAWGLLVFPDYDTRLLTDYAEEIWPFEFEREVKIGFLEGRLLVRLLEYGDFPFAFTWGGQALGPENFLQEEQAGLVFLRGTGPLAEVLFVYDQDYPLSLRMVSDPALLQTWWDYRNRPLDFEPAQQENPLGQAIAEVIKLWQETQEVSFQVVSLPYEQDLEFALEEEPILRQPLDSLDALRRGVMVELPSGLNLSLVAYGEEPPVILPEGWRSFKAPPIYFVPEEGLFVWQTGRGTNEFYVARVENEDLVLYRVPAPSEEQKEDFMEAAQGWQGHYEFFTEKLKGNPQDFNASLTTLNLVPTGTEISPDGVELQVYQDYQSGLQLSLPRASRLPEMITWDGREISFHTELNGAQSYLVLDTFFPGQAWALEQTGTQGLVAIPLQRINDFQLTLASLWQCQGALTEFFEQLGYQEDLSQLFLESLREQNFMESRGPDHWSQSYLEVRALPAEAASERAFQIEWLGYTYPLQTYPLSSDPAGPELLAATKGPFNEIFFVRMGDQLLTLNSPLQVHDLSEVYPLEIPYDLSYHERTMAQRSRLNRFSGQAWRQEGLEGQQRLETFFFGSEAGDRLYRNLILLDSGVYPRTRTILRIILKGIAQGWISDIRYFVSLDQSPIEVLLSKRNADQSLAVTLYSIQQRSRWGAPLSNAEFLDYIRERHGQVMVEQNLAHRLIHARALSYYENSYWLDWRIDLARLENEYSAYDGEMGELTRQQFDDLVLALAQLKLSDPGELWLLDKENDSIVPEEIDFVASGKASARQVLESEHRHLLQAREIRNIVRENLVSKDKEAKEDPLRRGKP
ncbi:MAG: hypothetical protein KDK66_00185 [Deltaproteobacteria bacterium]|nr:hypothetical protein [Deltaproteobacteria bacterium]